MKKLFFTLVFLFAGNLLAQTATAPSGSGTAGDPYLIATLNNLYWITQNSSAWDKVYRQTGDIDATTSSSWGSGAGFSPIGDGTTQFTGSYDGQTYKIMSMFINRSTTNYIGLFGYVSGATISNVKLESVNITGSYSVGGLIGFQYSSTATNCYSSGSVTGSGNVGGLIGFQVTSYASNCYSSGSVTGSVQFVGGLIGYQNNYSDASNCYSTGSVTGTSYVGGLIGFQVTSYASNCYSTGLVTGGSHLGGLIGSQSGSNTVSNCFWDTTSSGQTSSAAGSGESTAHMKNYLTFTGWSFKGMGGGNIWNIGNGRNNGYPYFDWQYPGDPLLAVAPSTGDGSSGNPYQIATLSNLYWITQTSSSWSSYFIQTADIDAAMGSSLDGGAGFSPIGDSTIQFTGSYDGQTYKIAGLSISRSRKNYIGFFGWGAGATITNVKLDNVNISGAVYVGGLIGDAFNVTATNCYSTGTVGGFSACGGLIGYQQSGNATNSYSSGIVPAFYYVGGLIGYQDVGGNANSCYSSGSIAGNSYVGGLIGYQQSGNATNCYSSDSVLGWNPSLACAGGLIGCSIASPVTNCYSSGLVWGSVHFAGGLIGCGGSPVTNCFWDTLTSLKLSSAGGTGQSTTKMKTQSTFTDAGWDVSIWNMGDGINNGYPYLRWQNPSGTPLPVESTSFTATSSNSSTKLVWKTATEVNNYGFEVQRKTINTWAAVGFVEATGTSNSPKEYSFTDRNLSAGEYSYRLKQIDRNGAFKYSSEVKVVVGIAPKVFALSQNYPNPFNPSTTIEFTLDADGHVLLKLYDVTGREVTTLLNEDRKAGYYHSVTFDASRLGSGTYFYRLQANGKMLSKKMMLLK